MAFKDSISTPVRTIFDASASTSSGFSLNDCLAQGSPNLVKLLSMLLEWQMGRNALVGDISQFYPTVLLVPKHWRYQRILLRENLDPNGQLLDAVIVKLAFGISSVSAQTEEVVRRLATRLKEEFSEVCDLLLKSRYVDDLFKSTSSGTHSQALAADVPPAV